MQDLDWLAPRPMSALLVELLLLRAVSLPFSPQCSSCYKNIHLGGTPVCKGCCHLSSWPLPTPVPLCHSQLPIPFHLVSRRCTIRTATGMTPAFAVPSAFTPWPVRPLWPRTTRSCATSAPRGRTPSSARAATSRLWQVLPTLTHRGGQGGGLSTEMMGVACDNGANAAVSCS